jgi:hypothetical protein
MNRRVYAFIGLIAVAATAFLSGLPLSDLFTLSRDDAFGLAAFVVLGLVSQTMVTTFAVQSGQAAAASLIFLPLFACAILFGPTAVVFAVVVIQLWSELVLLQRIIWRTVFNLSQSVLAYGVAAWVYDVLLTIFPARNGISTQAFVAMAIACLIINHAIVGAFYALRHERPLGEVMPKLVGPGGANLLYDLLASPVAIFAAMLYLQIGVWGVVLIFFPLLLLRTTYAANARLIAANNDLLTVLAKTIETRDPYTSGHSARVAALSSVIAQDAGMSPRQIEIIETAARLHDVGKIGVPDAILRKPSKLTPEEKAIMDKHPEYSWSILRMFPGLEQASLFALHHHENYDGTGYPGKLKGKEIPLGSRIVSVIDAYDAMISNRVYRKGLPHEEAIRRLLADSGTQFDPDVVQSFVPISSAQVSEVFAATGTSATAVL